MAIFGLVVFLIIAILGLVVIPLGIPGTIIIAGSTVIVGLTSGWQVITVTRLLLFFGLAVVAELIDLALGIFGSRSFGASKISMVGAFMGGLVGAFLGLPLPIIGNLVGAFVGAFLGAFLLESLFTGDVNRGIKSGFGAFFGRVIGSLVKVALGVSIIVMVVFAVV
ncbi:DUF456 domain-containing protein [Candidatus Bipolaricaulota bacterium]|nr:DUF456 domain-containing protein [Candidatus Bipolaricaulota bacterium]